MDWSDRIALAALIVSAFSLYVTKRTVFVNTVTTERMKWINSVRENIPTFPLSGVPACIDGEIKDNWSNSKGED